MRLIDADALKTRMLEYYEDSWNLHKEIMDFFDNTPTIEPERKKGEWKKSYADHEAFGVRPFFRYCSECNESTVWAYNFCPNCGADMRGESNEAD